MLEVTLTNTFQDDTGVDFDVCFTAKLWREVWGEDADGNRGVAFVDYEFDITEINNKSWKVYNEDLVERLAEKVDKWMYDNASETYNGGYYARE